MVKQRVAKGQFQIKLPSFEVNSRNCSILDGIKDNSLNGISPNTADSTKYSTCPEDGCKGPAIIYDQC